MSSIGEAYRRLRGLLLDRPYNFSWVDNMLAACGRPVSRSQVMWLYEQGIRALLSLTESPLPNEWLESTDIVYMHVPMEDHEPPSVEDLEKCVNFILSNIRAGRPTAVHCAAGLGRTGTVIAAYFVASERVYPNEAIEKIRKLRPGSVEPMQESSVYAFAEKVFSEL
ncbi:MAG: dual specificity protein phosphatase family protein [Nitrososphaerota archaeon]|nr:dual specificity protein phosphatase family protein [Aigarchaeota archaeon]MDW8077204.1 dual specificity protein phosphatase family protein [Nitrososphaerota archaeon]